MEGKYGSMWERLVGWGCVNQNLYALLGFQLFFCCVQVEVGDGSIIRFDMCGNVEGKN